MDSLIYLDIVLGPHPGLVDHVAFCSKISVQELIQGCNMGSDYESALKEVI